MRIAVCRLPEGGSIVVQAHDRGRVFRGGDRVELDAIAVPASGTRAAQTWADVLGHHVVDHFALERAAADGNGPAVGDDAPAVHEE